MNQNNPFGSTQSGAFQAPSNTVKQVLFQPVFGQQSSASQPQQSMGFFGTGFGQAPSSSAFGQGPAFGQATTTTQQAPAFGQVTTTTPQQQLQQAPAFGQASTTAPQQAPAFGQASTTAPQQAPTFGQASTTAPQQAPTFGQASTTAPQQAPTFGQASTTAPQQAPTFGQASTTTPQQASVFGQASSTALQASVFGQASTTAPQQASVFGQASTTAPQQASVFGQTSTTAPQQAPSFGQATKATQQTSGFGQASTTASQQASVFGQTSTATTQQAPPAFGQQSNSVFGGSSSSSSSSTAAFGQNATPSNQSSVFGQVPSFGATFGQSGGFGQGFSGQTSAFGAQQAQQFGQTSTSSSGLRFGQPVFGQPTSTTSTTSVFVTSSSNPSQSRSFVTSEFSFKPISSASPEPTTTTISSLPFGGAQPASTTSSSASLFSSAKPAITGFSFSQPATLPGAQQPSAATSSNAPTSGLQFTFSQPATPSSSSTKTTASVSQPTTPSTFSFTPKTHQLQPKPLFGPSKFGQTFGEAKDKEGDDKKSNAEPTAETNVFARLGKAPKHKEDVPGSSVHIEIEATKEETAGEADAPRQPPKRPLVRSRGPPPGLFGRALSGLRRDMSGAPKREAKQLDWDAPEEEEAERQRAATPPTTSAPAMRETVEKTNVTDPSPSSAPAPLLASPPSLLGRRRDSADSLSGLSPSDCTVLHCRPIPPSLNRKDVLEKHFGRFGKVRRVFCRPKQNFAIVHFDHHASAARAKRRGQMLHKHELQLRWQRKKPSPGEREPRGTPGQQQQQQQEQQQEQEDQGQVQTMASSPLKRPLLSSSVTFSSPVKKSPMARTLQFEEPPREPSAEPPPLDRTLERSVDRATERPAPSSLLHLIGQTAETAEDKYRLLEQRDKILRQGRSKRTDFLVGTCPDMCPEKERYMRETRKQLSVYEVLPNTEMVDHGAAIKEYSRSSADQEEPLPYELRPLPVLTRTMDYIVTQILDQGEDNYREWFDFVWNRTRSIRKDIIQQHLGCPDTVVLIEKCTRFHVHCAHQLCEEPMSSFDPKINNENMTKCLQSLKEMYEDLSTRGVYCPREAEFRQYNVLLKLNDGDILREVQQFRDEIRNSAEVKFAVQVFSAVNMNNFVRFFKLVRSTSYLSSCMLHRYFNQVRSRALTILNMAHTVGPRSTAFPLDDIVRMLMFRDGDEATAFIQQYGLNVSDGVVELSRTSFQEPDLPVRSHRSEVILSKRRVPIGEVVNGERLPSPPQHSPVCSFDAQNKYRDVSDATIYKAGASRSPVPHAAPAFEPAAFDRPPVFGAVLVQSAPPAPGAEETGESAPFVPAPERQFQPISQPSAPPPAPAPAPVPVKAPTPPPPKPVYSDEEIASELNRMLEEVVDAALMEMAEAAAGFTSAALQVSSEQVESVVAEVTGNLLKDISTAEIKLEQDRIAEEKRRLEEARRKQEHEAFLIDYSFSLCSELVYEVLDETIKKVAASEIQAAVDEKTARVARCTEDVCSRLLEETLNTHIELLVKQILDVELQRIQKYIKRWRDVVFMRRQLKRQMRAFPAAPCFVDPRFRLRALAPSAPDHTSIELLSKGLVNLGHSGDLSVSSSRLLKIRDAVIHQMRVQYFYQLLINATSWAPLDLPALAMEHFPNPPPNIFWKTLLLLPSEHETGASVADRILCDWLEVKLGSEECSRRPDGTLHSLCVSRSVKETGQNAHTVHVAVKVSYGPLSEDGLCQMEESCELQGTAALLMLLPASALLDQDLDQDQDLPLLSALLQLKQLQQANTWHCPLPLVILVPGQERGHGHVGRLAQALMLSKLVEDGLISEYNFVFLPENTSDLQGSKQLTDSLLWLLARAPPVFPLSCQTLVQLVETALSRDFSSRVYSHRQERASAALAPQRPLPVIRLYNAVLDHVARAVSSPELCKLSWPPAEFSVPETRGFVPHVGWNSSEHLKWVREAVLSLQLPEWDSDAPTDSWSELCCSIFSFAAQIPASRRSQPLLMSRLENLLERVRAGVQTRRTPGAKMSWCSWADGEEELCPAFDRVPWDDVLVICIDHKLKDWTLPGPLVSEDAVTEDGEILVYFPSEALGSFSAPEEWAEAVKQTHREIHERGEWWSGAARAPAPALSLQKRLFFCLKEPERPLEPSLDFSHTATPEEALAHRVLLQLEQEKQESNRTMEQFQRWSDGGALEQLYPPLFVPSTLLSVPMQVLPPTGRTRETTANAQVLDSEVGSDVPVVPDVPNAPRPSLSWRVKELERQILTSRDEESATKLHLSQLLNIVQD